MIVNATRTIASSTLLLSAACIALAQEPPQFPSAPENYVPAQPATFVVKDASAVPPPAANLPVPKWDGEKPFLPEVHEPQFPPRQFPREMLDGFRQVAATAFNLWDVSVQEVRSIDHHGEKLVALQFPEGQRVVRLHPHSLREEGARLLVDVGGGVLIDQPWPAITTYRGTVDGAPNYDVAASLIEGKVSMLILPSDDSLPSWYLQPMDDALAGMPAGMHVLYRSVDVISTGHECGVGQEGVPPMIHPHPEPPAAPLWSNPGLVSTENTTVQEKAETHEGDEGGIAGDEGSLAVANVRCQIGLDADYEFYQANGSSVVNTIYDMDLIMNQVGLLYQNQVEIAYTETFIIVRSSPADPYFATAAGTILCEFGDWWNANVTATRDVAHLFTGKDMDGNTVGLAWPGVICNVNLNTNPPCNGGNKAYSIAQSRFSAIMANRVQDTAHELGHNWSACHCDQSACTGSATPDADCGIMNSIVSIGALTFGTRARNAIRAHRDSRTCLDVWQNPVYVNWSWTGTENGSISNPFNTIFEGLDACLVNGTMIVQGGNYLQNPNIFKAKNIQAVNGTVRIGSN